MLTIDNRHPKSADYCKASDTLVSGMDGDWMSSCIRQHKGALQHAITGACRSTRGRQSRATLVPVGIRKRDENASPIQKPVSF